MKWIEASERLPEATNGRAKQIVVKFVFKDDVQMRVLTANGFIDLIKMCTDKDKIEWLDEESNVSSQEPDAIGQVLEDALLGLGSAKAIIDDTNAMEIDTPDNGAMSDCYQNLIEAMASIIKFQASKEIDEPLIQNNSINDDDFEEDPDPTCEACGYNHGNHMKGCPNDDSPFALLCRRGFD